MVQFTNGALGTLSGRWRSAAEVPPQQPEGDCSFCEAITSRRCAASRI